MKKLISALVLALVAACNNPQPATSPSPRPAGATVAASNAGGASDARGAVLGFMSAVHDQDLQRIAAMWGTKEGSVRDGGMARQELERRELVMLCYLRHQSAKVISDAPAPDNHRVFAVELSRGGVTRSTNFYVVQGPGSRYYVENVDLEPLQDLVRHDRCQR